MRGNSPSQTEVKIISCIPIDVTDLQNKIISLERQLFEVTNCKSSTRNAPVHTTLIEPTRRSTNAVLSCKCSGVTPLGLEETSTMMPQRTDATVRNGKSTVSFLFPTMSTAELQKNQPYKMCENWDEKSININTHGRHKTFFRKCKKKPLKKKLSPKTQMVYYAHTESSPFANYDVSTDIPYINYSKPCVKNTFSKTYLTNVLQRHFHPDHVVEEYSDTSHFTSPVCRDFPNSAHRPYESDVCSCCHGQFQDVDKYISNKINFIIEPNIGNTHNRFNKDIYNDSTLYDIVPVREKTTKISKEPSTKEPKRPVDIRCWPESARSKPRQTTAMYHHPKTHTKYKKVNPHFQDLKDNTKNKINKMDKKRGPTDTSNSCCVDCSEIYPKPLFASHKADKPQIEQIKPVFQKNAECLTIDVETKNLTITRSIQIDIDSTETKTEETLNQIKSILQSVLAEVKTNPQVYNVPEVKSKKDAVIQKGPSQNNMETCSSLLHSFTYNDSYNTNPYLPSCSRQIPSPFCYTNMSHQRPNYTQNFPLLIQTPGHQKCGCFLKNRSLRSSAAQKPATTTATNTEINDQDAQGRETEKLIKEIYKSIALTMETPKETSNSEYEELKSLKNNSTNAGDYTQLRNPVTDFAEAPKRNIQIEASMTPLSTTTVRTNYTNNLTDIKRDGKWKNDEHYYIYDSQSTEHEIFDEEAANRGKANVVASTISEHYSEELSSESEEEMVTTLNELKNVKDTMEKKGLLKRMLRSVKLFNKKKQKKKMRSQKQDMPHDVNDEKSESDSDDYQTIYSDQLNMPKQNFNKSLHYKPGRYVRSKPIHQKTGHQRFRDKRTRGSPYMEQEYRRQWNEELMFQRGRGRKYSSERLYSNQQAPLYWQNFEARSAMVNQRAPYPNPIHAVPVRTVVHKVGKRTSPFNITETKDDKLKFCWLKKHKLGISQCGEQWKKFILEN